MKRFIATLVVLSVVTIAAFAYGQQRRAQARPSTAATEECRVFMFLAPTEDGSGCLHWITSGPVTVDNGCFSFDGYACKTGRYDVIPSAARTHYRITGTVVVESKDRH